MCTRQPISMFPQYVSAYWFSPPNSSANNVPDADLSGSGRTLTRVYMRGLDNPCMPIMLSMSASIRVDLDST